MNPVTTLLLRRLRPLGADQPLDLRIDGGIITEIGHLAAVAGEEVIDYDGRTFTAGLVDHHAHLTQWATLSRRLDLSGASSAAHAAALVAEALPLSSDGVFVGFGYRAPLWSDPPTVAALDAVTGERPAVLGSADLHSTWLNSAALRLFGHDPAAVEGPLREDDAFAVLRNLADIPDETADAWVAEAMAAAAARGVTRVVDFEMAWNLGVWTRRAAASPLPVRIDFGIYPQDLARALREGLRTGQVVDGAGLVRVGSLKVISDGSLTTKTACCVDPYPGTDQHGVLNVSPSELADLLDAANRGGVSAAVHAIGDEANRLALDAFALTGAHGSIEHAQLLRHADVARIAELGLAASVQPEHAMDDRDVADTLWAARTGRAFMLRSLIDAGVRVTFGSDAPVAPLDPWQAISAAVYRTRDHRPAWHPEQIIGLHEAVAASTDRPVAVGAAADLAILDGDAVGADARTLRSMPVAATLLAGRFTHRS